MFEEKVHKNMATEVARSMRVLTRDDKRIMRAAYRRAKCTTIDAGEKAQVRLNKILQSIMLEGKR